VLGLAHGDAIDLSDKASVRLEDCFRWPLCLPDRSLSLHPRLNEAGAPIRPRRDCGPAKHCLPGLRAEESDRKPLREPEPQSLSHCSLCSVPCPDPNSSYAWKSDPVADKISPRRRGSGIKRCMRLAAKFAL
jgi:hypothetical protein